jgi:hypothetical protein
MAQHDQAMALLVLFVTTSIVRYRTRGARASKELV